MPLEQGQQPFENLIEIKKAHNIRRLCRCPDGGNAVTVLDTANL